MRHLTFISHRPRGHGRRRMVLAGAAATALALGSAVPVAALDGPDDDTVSVASQEEGSSSTSPIDDAVEDTSDSLEEAADDPEATVDEVVDTVTKDDPEEEPDEPADEPDEPDEKPDEPEKKKPDEPENSDEPDEANEEEHDRSRDGATDPAQPAPSPEKPDDGGEADADEVDKGNEGEDDEEEAPEREADRPTLPRAPSQLLLRTGYEPLDLEVAAPLVAGDDSARSTDEVLAMLQRAGASESTIARTLAPFPVAGPASYGNDGTHEVELRTSEGTPVVAAGTGTVEVIDLGNGAAVELTGHDGTTYRYEGLRPATLRVEDGDEVGFGQTLGQVAGLDLDGAQLAFALWSPAGEQLPALRYLDRWLSEAEAAASELSGAADGAFAPVIAPPADRGAELAAPEDGTTDQSGMSPARAEGVPATVTVGGLVAAALGAYLALRTRRWPLLEDREGFLSAVDELGPRA